MIESTGFHFFADQLRQKISGQKNSPEVQYKQLTTLFALEKKWLKELLKTEAGRSAYLKFIQWVFDTRYSVLDARPYYRERYTTFVSGILPGMKENNLDSLAEFRINWKFINWILQNGRFPKRSKIRTIPLDIAKVREELVLLNSPLAINHASIFWRKVKAKPHSQEFTDYVQCALDAITASVDKFVPSEEFFLNKGEMSSSSGEDPRSAFAGMACQRMTGSLIRTRSQTLLKYYPKDKQALYGANKAAAKCEEGEIPRVKGMAPEEVQRLLRSASPMSLDVRRCGDMPDNTENRPDVVMEHKEQMGQVMEAIQKLPLVDKKILRMKGVSFQI